MNIRRESLEGGGVVHQIFDRPGSTAKPSIFIAEADIKELFTADVSEAEVQEVEALGQDVFFSIDALTISSVAAIHGASMGGGFEIALACDCRVASGDKVTKIGLPETQLGLLPAWGGCTRLPRVIGLPTALDIIFAGEYSWLEAGIVEQVTQSEG